MGRGIGTSLGFLASLTLALTMAGQAQESPAPSHVGRVIDSSFHHFVASGGLQTANLNTARQEPRVLFRLAERHLDGQEPAIRGRRSGDLRVAPGRYPVFHCDKLDGTCANLRIDSGKIDWSVSLGSGTVPANMFPAKFGFNINATPDCKNDYAVFALDVPGVTGGQANLVGINQLYSGSSPTGLCGANPSIYWAYNGSTNGGPILTSAQISMDGTKIAFIESAAGASIFHILTWKSGEGNSATGAAAPTAAGSCTLTSSCLISLSYSNSATTTLASPWIDYNSDKAFVASDDGKIYRLSCAFHCTLNSAPTVDWSYSLPVAGSAGAAPVPNGPVFDANTGRLFVGDQLGELWVLNAAGATPSLYAGPVMIGGGGCTTTNPPGRTGTPKPCTASGGSYGMPDSVLLDVTTQKVLAFSGNDGTANNSATVAQMNEDLSGLVRVHVGRGSVGNTTSNVDLHAGAFDNNYWGTTPTSGHLFLCGTAPNNTTPYHYWIGFSAYPTMDSAPAGSLARGFPVGTPCTPYTEVYNPTLNLSGNPNHHDLQVSGLVAAGANGYIITNDISGGNVTSAVATQNYPGGPSAIIPDNLSSQAQASSFYFSTLGTPAVGNCPANVHCAVKLTQVSLQ